MLNWWIACLEWVKPRVPLPTPQNVKIKHNLKNKNKTTPCSERLRSRWTAAARSRAAACAPGGTLGLQMDPAKACRWASVKATHLPSNPSLLPASRGGASERGKAQPEEKRQLVPGAGRKSAPDWETGLAGRLRSRKGPISKLPGALGMRPRPRQHSRHHLPHFRSAARLRSQVLGSGFFSTESRGLSGSPAEGGAVRGAYVQRLTHARTASLRRVEQFRHCADREGTVTPMT